MLLPRRYGGGARENPCVFQFSVDGDGVMRLAGLCLLFPRADSDGARDASYRPALLTCDLFY
jgi:hypothetical protein